MSTVLLVLVCLVWACNNIISKIVVAHWGVPPLFYAAVRFAIVATTGGGAFDGAFLGLGMVPSKMRRGCRTWAARR